MTGSNVFETYPCLTVQASGEKTVYPTCVGLTIVAPAASGRGTTVWLERIDDDLDTLADRLEEELAEGGCA